MTGQVVRGKLPSGRPKPEPEEFFIDIDVCMNCGLCAEFCPFDAIMVTESTPGIHNAEVDDALCRGCGLCLAHCPTGALNQNGYNDRQLIASLEAILS